MWCTFALSPVASNAVYGLRRPHAASGRGIIPANSLLLAVRQPICPATPQSGEEIHGARHRRGLRRQGRESLRAGAAGGHRGAHDFQRLAAHGRSRQRQEPGGCAAGDRRPDGRAGGSQGRPDPFAAEVRRSGRARGRAGADDRLDAPTRPPATTTATSPSTACRRRSCCAAWRAWFRRTRPKSSEPLRRVPTPSGT